MTPPLRRSTRWRVDSERGRSSETPITNETHDKVNEVINTGVERARAEEGGGIVRAGQTTCNLENTHTFLNVVVRKRSSILQLLPGEDESLLVWRDALLVLDLGLDVLNGVRGLHLQGNGLTRQCLDEDLHLHSPHAREIREG